MNMFHYENDTLGYDDGRKIVVGKWLEVNCEPELCKAGLHASERLVDATTYSEQFAYLALVEVGGTIVRGDDKVAAKRRRTIARIPTAELYPRLTRLACTLMRVVYGGNELIAKEDMTPCQDPEARALILRSTKETRARDVEEAYRTVARALGLPC